MSASASVPASCIARSAAIATTSPPLQSPSARADGAIALAGEALEGRIRLEHRVEMAAQEDALAASVAAMDRDEMAGPARLAHVHPAHLEAQRLQLGAHHLARRAHAGEVERAAVLVHQSLEQREIAIGIAPDRLDDTPLGGRERGLAGNGGRGGGEKGERGEYLHGPTLGRDPAPGQRPTRNS
jgi:hypothetical protein